MALTKTELSLLENIQGKRRRGDINAVAKKTGFSQEYVSMVLNPKTDYWDEKIIAGAIEMINKREQNTKKLLEKLIA